MRKDSLQRHIRHPNHSHVQAECIVPLIDPLKIKASCKNQIQEYLQYTTSNSSTYQTFVLISEGSAQNTQHWQRHLPMLVKRLQPKTNRQ